MSAIAAALRRHAAELLVTAGRLDRTPITDRTAAKAQALEAERLHEQASKLSAEAERIEQAIEQRLEAERRARTRPLPTTPMFFEQTLALGNLLSAHRALRLALSESPVVGGEA